MHTVPSEVSGDNIILDSVDTGVSIRMDANSKIFNINGSLDIIKQILNHFIITLMLQIFLHVK